MTRYAIGVDVGGSSIKAGLVDDTGQLLFKHTQPTPPPDQPEAVLAAIIEAGEVSRTWARQHGCQIQGFGFGMPQLIEGPDWTQRHAHNLGLEGTAMHPPLQAAFGPTLAMDNDVNAAALGEYRYGAGQGCERMLFMAIGTGISCGFFTETGRLLRYNYSTAGDTGHIIVDPQGETLCSCGGRGCLEAVASAPAVARQGRSIAETGQSPLLARRLAEQGHLSARDVAEAAGQGDPAAQTIIDQTGRFLGIGLTSLVHIFRPQLILIGGGLVRAGELLLSPTRTTLTHFGSPFFLNQLQAVQAARLGPEAGLIGAAALIFYDEGVSSG